MCRAAVTDFSFLKPFHCHDTILEAIGRTKTILTADNILLFFAVGTLFSQV